MKKFIFSLLVSLCALLSINVHAQDKYYYVQYATSVSVPVVMQTTNIGITTSQTISPGVVNTWTNTAPGGYYTNPSGIFSYGAYWLTPTIITPVTVQVLSGYTATILNSSGISTKIQLILHCGGTLFYGSVVTIPSGGTVTTPIPAGAYTYTTTPTASALITLEMTTNNL